MLNKAPNYEVALGNAKTSALDGGERLCSHLHRFIPDMGSHVSISVWTRGGVPAVAKEEIFISVWTRGGVPAVAKEDICISGSARGGVPAGATPKTTVFPEASLTGTIPASSLVT
jgi:hypothetical protein